MPQSGRPRSATVTVRRRDTGSEESAEWGQASVEFLAGAAPWRAFRWRHGQRHYSGTYWSSTEADHVVYESRLELSRLLFADFDEPATAHVSWRTFPVVASRIGRETATAVDNEDPLVTTCPWHSCAVTIARSARHRRLSAFLASYDDGELAALVETGRASSVGVGGGSSVLDIDGVPVFVKRIPLTGRELAHPGSTANLFDLPVRCQYGIASPGFNAWRELAANRVVTDAVLAGETQSFPVLYHWRVLPSRSPVAAEHADIDGVVAALGGSPAVRVRLEALVAASCSLVLFCEYIAHPLRDWLREDPVGKAVTVERQFSQIVTFLRDRELLHMDGHFGNMRTDGERIYLSDMEPVTIPV